MDNKNYISPVAEIEALKNKISEDFWTKKLSGLSFHPLCRSTGNPGQAFASGKTDFVFPEVLWFLLRDKTGGEQLNIYKVLLGTLFVLSYRYTCNEDNLIAASSFGNTVSNGPDSPVFLYGKIAPEDTFSKIVKQVHQEVQEANRYSNYSYRNFLLRRRSADSAYDERLHLGMALYPYNQQAGFLDTVQLLFEFTLQENAPAFSIRYNTCEYTISFIRFLGDNFLHALSSVLNSPRETIKKLSLLSPAEEDLLHSGSGATFDGYQPFQTVTEAFAEQAKLHPEETALVKKGLQITYDELDKKSDRLARHLIAVHKLQKGQAAGVLLGLSEYRVIALMAILKAGGVYVPISPASPSDRISYTISNAGIILIITDEQHASKLDTDVKIITAEQEIANTDIALPKILPSDLAYIIYTSGSTGAPKGVMIAHGSLAGKIYAELAFLEIKTPVNTLHLTNYTFDVSLIEIFKPLLTGGQMVIPETIEDFPYLQGLIPAHKVNYLTGTPSFFNSFLRSTRIEDPSSLEHICIGGESLNEEIAKLIRNALPHVSLNNFYGPTECTIDATGLKNIESFPRNIIGLPLPGTFIYIINALEEYAPAGTTGEICIGGTGVGKGYLGDPELTASRFIPDPFHPGERLYRTGDLGRHLHDGHIEFLGRKDDQVKIRGYRIEPGEIEAALLRHAEITAAAVIAFETSPGDKTLVAYITGGNPGDDELIRFLSKDLPAYMIPACFVSLEKLPYTSNGKIDRRKLPAPVFGKAKGQYIPPRHATDEQLCLIWQEILSKSKIGIDDNFFESGGHSLKATQLISRVHKELHAAITLRDVFANPSVRQIADHIQGIARTAFLGITPAPVQEHYALSHAQQRLWIIDQLEKGCLAYNMSEAYRFEGHFNPEAFRKTLATVVERHEALRTVFITVNGAPRQKINPVGFFELQQVDLSMEKDKDESVQKIAFEEANTPFDLEKGPLLRAKLIRTEERKHIFLFTLHHIVSDGWSMELLVNEVTTLYQHYCSGDGPLPLPPLKIQYKDYSQWQNNNSFRKEEEFWLSALSGKLRPMQLPYDASPDNTSTYVKGGTQSHWLDEKTVRVLRQLAIDHNTTLSTIVLTVFKILLYQKTGQNDITVGVAIANRNHPDIEPLIGFFINVLAIHTEITGQEEFTELVDRVAKNTLGAFDNQDYPFDLLIEKLNPSRKASRQPLFNVMYGYQNYSDLAVTDKQVLETYTSGDSGLRVERMEHGVGVTQFDMTHRVYEHGDRLLLEFSYDSGIFRSPTITKMLESYEALFRMITN